MARSAASGAARPIDLATTPPAVILLAGLQGAGKTTSAAKLARLLRQDQKKKVLLVSCDVYRPAAIAQLQTLASQVGAECELKTAAECDAVNCSNHRDRHLPPCPDDVLDKIGNAVGALGEVGKG